MEKKRKRRTQRGREKDQANQAIPPNNKLARNKQEEGKVDMLSSDPSALSTSSSSTSSSSSSPCYVSTDLFESLFPLRPPSKVTSCCVIPSLTSHSVDSCSLLVNCADNSVQCYQADAQKWKQMAQGQEIEGQLPYTLTQAIDMQGNNTMQYTAHTARNCDG